MVFPWIPFLKSRRRRLSDTEFMAIKAFDGKVIVVTGAIDALNDTIEYIPASGKTFYFHSAKIVISTHATPPAITSSATQNTVVKDMVKAALKINTVTVDTTNIGTSANATTEGTSALKSGGSGVGTVGDGHFDVKGRFLTGDGAKKIEIVNTLDAGSAVATLIGFIEDTADSPQI